MVARRGCCVSGKPEDEDPELPPGYVYQVIANGYGAMPGYGDQIQEVRDRWAIVAYIRALQLSREAQLSRRAERIRAAPQEARLHGKERTDDRIRSSPELLDDLRRVLWPALGLGILLTIASIVGGIFDPGDFFRSYLMGYLFWLGLSLGSLGVVMMQYLTSGAWGVMTRRTFESATRTLPFLALLFIPIACATPVLYDWAHPDLVHREYSLAHRSGYMNTTMFILRAVAYFAIWLAFAYFLNKWSAEQDETDVDTNRIERRLAAISAPGLILYVFTVTFSSVDWAESLETDWYSTMWGFLFVARQGLTAFAFVIIVLTLLARREPLTEQAEEVAHTRLREVASDVCHGLGVFRFLGITHSLVW